MLLRQILASTCRQKILETLATVGDVHIMELVRRTNSTYCQVRRNLTILIDNSVVTIKQHGRAKVVKLNRNDEKSQALLKALNILAIAECKQKEHSPPQKKWQPHASPRP